MVSDNDQLVERGEDYSSSTSIKERETRGVKERSTLTPKSSFFSFLFWRNTKSMIKLRFILPTILYWGNFLLMWCYLVDGNILVFYIYTILLFFFFRKTPVLVSMDIRNKCYFRLVWTRVRVFDFPVGRGDEGRDVERLSLYSRPPKKTEEYWSFTFNLGRLSVFSGSTRTQVTVRTNEDESLNCRE